MFAAIKSLLNTVFGRHSDWRPDIDGEHMKRWHDGRIERRKMTDEETQEAAAWQAIR